MIHSSLKKFGASIKVILIFTAVISIISMVYSATVPVILLLTLGIILIVNGVTHFIMHFKTPSIFRSVDLTFAFSIISAVLGIYLLYNIIHFIYF